MAISLKKLWAVGLKKDEAKSFVVATNNNNLNKEYHLQITITNNQQQSIIYNHKFWFLTF